MALKIEYLEDEIPVYDITVEGTENFYANDILVHNCQEITIPSKDLDIKDPTTGEIALCTLAAINLGKITNTNPKELLKFFRKYGGLANRALDAILDYQDYPVLAAEKANKSRRPLGIGVINLAYYLAKNNMKYSDDSSLELVDRTFEAMQYGLIESSVELAKEFGKCDKFHETKYAKGIMPVDRYKKGVDEVIFHDPKQDWSSLRDQVLEFGMRNSILTAAMPSETSSQTSNATNGVEPPLNFVTIKESKDGIMKQVVPEYAKLKNKYELRWDMSNTRGYLKICAVIQKYFDQSISTNTHYNPEKFDGGKISIKDKLMDLLLAYKWGIKTLYYDITKDGMTDENEDSCDSGACKI